MFFSSLALNNANIMCIHLLLFNLYRHHQFLCVYCNILHSSVLRCETTFHLNLGAVEYCFFYFILQHLMFLSLFFFLHIKFKYTHTYKKISSYCACPWDIGSSLATARQKKKYKIGMPYALCIRRRDLLIIWKNFFANNFQPLNPWTFH